MDSVSPWALQVLRRISSDLLTFHDGRLPSADQLISYQIVLELVYREIIMAESVNDDASNVRGRELLIRHVFNNYKTRLALVCPVPPTNLTGDVGRPRFIILREQLQYLIEAQFSVPHISRLEFRIK